MGWWNADGTNLWGEDQSKRAWRYPYQVSADRLTIQCPDDQGGTVVYERIKETP